MSMMASVSEHQQLQKNLAEILPELAWMLADSPFLHLALLDGHGVITWANRAMEGNLSPHCPLVGREIASILTAADAAVLVDGLKGRAAFPRQGMQLKMAPSDGMPYSYWCRLLAVGDGFLFLAEPPPDADRAQQSELLELINQLSTVSRENIRKGRELARVIDELRRSREQLSSTLEAIPDLLYELDEAGTYLKVHTTRENTLSNTMKEAIGRNVREVLPAEAAAVLLDALKSAKRTGLDYGRICRLPIEQGEAWFELSVSRTRSPSGEPQRFIVLSRDISARKHAEEWLRKSEARMRAITDSAQDAIIMMDPDGCISFWNPAAERIFGFLSNEAVGRNLHTFIASSPYLDEHLAAFPMFQQTGNGNAIGKTLDICARRKDGTEIPVQLSLAAVHLDNGWHAVGILRDITEIKQAEEALIAAKEQADAASQAKSEFLANMSHEIRTPMNGVIGMAGLLADTELTDEQRRYTESIRSSGEVLLGIINDVLDFSKIEAGKMELETLNFDLRSLLEDFAATLAMRAYEKGLEFICAAAPNVPDYLQGDPGRLRQILINLAGNAIKFTPQGEVSVRTSLVSENEQDAVLRFSVKDTGIGIPLEKQGVLFQKFTQADTSTTRRYGGTGLGLAIAKELVELMGGEIGVISREGEGSEFWFTTCLGKQAGQESACLPVADIRGSHVLVVDDNATNREVLLAQLKAWELRGEAAADGPAGLQALHHARKSGDFFSAAIIDMQMPNMDGVELGRAIKEDAMLRDTRLILLTSLPQRGDARKMEEVGFDAYLTKPARQSELLWCLRAVLGVACASQPLRKIVTRHTVREFLRREGRILLVEDNITNQQVALGILKKMGLHAVAVTNGAEAVRALMEVPYDLVLMDVQMPVMNGFEATQRIRDPRSAVLNHDIPIVAMTANAMKGDRERCLAAGMNDYIVKPVNPQALAEALDAWLPKETSPVKHACLPSDSERQQEKPVFDRAGMVARLMEDEQLVRLVAEGFLEHIPAQVESLRRRLDAGDAAGVEMEAHTIKGAAANVGGERLRQAAQEMEKAGDLRLMKSLFPYLEAQAGALQRAIQQELLRGLHA